MSLNTRNLESTTLASVHPTAARTATGAGSAVDLLAFDGDVVMILDSAAGTGTTPTLDVSFTHSDTSAGTYTAISGSSFAQVTGTASQQRIAIDKDTAKRFIKANYTISGTSPSFTFSVNALGERKYK